MSIRVSRYLSYPKSSFYIPCSWRYFVQRSELWIDRSSRRPQVTWNSAVCGVVRRGCPRRILQSHRWRGTRSAQFTGSRVDGAVDWLSDCPIFASRKTPHTLLCTGISCNTRGNERRYSSMVPPTATATKHALCFAFLFKDLVMFPINYRFERLGMLADRSWLPFLRVHKLFYKGVYLPCFKYFVVIGSSLSFSFVFGWQDVWIVLHVLRK